MRHPFQHTFFRTALYWAGYLVWSFTFQLFALTLITYFLSTERGTGFQEMSDTLAANELTLMGLSSAGFLAFLVSLYPLTTISPRDLMSAFRLERYFMPGFFEGTMTASFIAIVFLAAGFYDYMGFFIQLNSTPVAILSILFRSAAILSFCIIEEFIFRKALLLQLSQRLPPSLAIVIGALLYGLTKSLQADLGWTQTITLIFIGLNLGVRSYFEQDFLRGAGYLSGLLIGFHVLLSLPVLGSEFQGILMLKPVPIDPEEQFWLRILTGGAGGPLSSIGFQLILIADLFFRWIRSARTG